MVVCGVGHTVITEDANGGNQRFFGLSKQSNGEERLTHNHLMTAAEYGKASKIF
jgi:hypothetical protein